MADPVFIEIRRLVWLLILLKSNMGIVFGWCML